MLYREIKTEGFEQVLSGYTLVTYDPGQGFFLENDFSSSEEVLHAVGEYLVDKHAYNFYLTTGEGGEMLSGGILRSGVRVEIRISSPAMFVADTYTLIAFNSARKPSPLPERACTSPTRRAGEGRRRQA